MKELEPQLILVKHEIKKNNIDQNILLWQYVWLPRNKLFLSCEKLINYSEKKRTDAPVSLWEKPL